MEQEQQADKTQQQATQPGQERQIQTELTQSLQNAAAATMLAGLGYASKRRAYSDFVKTTMKLN